MSSQLFDPVAPQVAALADLAVVKRDQQTGTWEVDLPDSAVRRIEPIRVNGRRLSATRVESLARQEAHWRHVRASLTEGVCPRRGERLDPATGACGCPSPWRSCWRLMPVDGPPAWYVRGVVPAPKETLVEEA